VEKPEGKTPLGRPRRSWVDNIKMDLREIEWDGMDWIELTHNSTEPLIPSGLVITSRHELHRCPVVPLHIICRENVFTARCPETVPVYSPVLRSFRSNGCTRCSTYEFNCGRHSCK
jgi:hypothetical protein